MTANELEEFKWTLDQYIERAKENKVSAVWEKELRNASAKIHLSRLDALKMRLRQTVEELHQENIKKITNAAEHAYAESYLQTAYEIQLGTGTGWAVGEIDNQKLKKLLAQPWTGDGKTFSDRVWSENARVNATINQELTRMTATGAAPQKAIDNVVKTLNTSRYNAGRLVMTESAFYATEAQKDCFNELAVEKYVIVETLSSSTCQMCGDLDGKVFPMKEFAAGLTAPPFHPNCRGATAPYFEDMEGIGQRAARDAVTGESFNVPKEMTYNEWKQMQDNKYGVNTVDKLRNARAKETSYTEQYRKYKERLGDAAPDTIDFVRLKESNSQEWTDLQRTYRYKGIDDRLLARNPSCKVLDINNGLPDAYKQQAAGLSKRSKEVVYKYTDGGVGCATINTYAGSGIIKAPTAIQDCTDLHNTLADMSLPYDTVVFRGTKREFVRGLDALEGKIPIADWKDRSISTQAFTSTSLFRDTAYSGEVQMTILVPKDRKGAGYVNDISYNYINSSKNEYEVSLQNESEYAIIEAQYFDKKLFLVVEWLGGK